MDEILIESVRKLDLNDGDVIVITPREIQNMPRYKMIEVISSNVSRIREVFPNNKVVVLDRCDMSIVNEVNDESDD